MPAPWGPREGISESGAKNPWVDILCVCVLLTLLVSVCGVGGRPLASPELDTAKLLFEDASLTSLLVGLDNTGVVGWGSEVSVTAVLPMAPA